MEQSSLVFVLKTHSAFLIGASMCSLTLWGFTLSIFSSASLLLWNLTAPEINLKLWPVNLITHTLPCWYSHIALVCVCVLLHSFIEKIDLCTKHNTHSATVSSPHRVHLSEIHLSRKSIVISCWKILICNYTKNFRTSDAWAESHPDRQGHRAIRHIFCWK